MNELLSIFFVVIAGGAVASLQASRYRRPERSWLLASFGAHVVTSFIQVWFTHAMYGSGDMTNYAYVGEALAAVMRIDPGTYVPEVVRLLFQQPAMLPLDILGQGSSTGTMTAIAGILSFLTGGGIYTLSCCVGMGAHFGQVYVYKAFASAFPRAAKKRLLFAALFVPSEVFWSCGLIKEGVAMLGLGLAVWGVERLVKGERLVPLAFIACGAVIIGLIKSYILVAITAGTVAYFFFNTTKRRDLLSRPVNIAAGALIGVIGSAMILRFFPNYTPDAVAEQAAYYQEMGQVVAGRSTYAIGDGSRTSFSGQIAFAPIALVTSLFRPFVFEARNPQVFVNAMETSTILVMLVRVFWGKKFSDVWARVTAQPMLVFSLVFMIIFGVGVGLTTTNLGTLSRYRMPLVPFLWVFALVLGEPERVPVAADEPSAVARLPRHRVHARAPTPSLARGAFK